MRCQSILLKSCGTKSKETGLITGMCATSVNSWLKRYESEGLSGLETKPGRGHKSILSEEDKPAILSAIKSNRQRMRTAKAAWEAASGKKVGDPLF
jgi:transposase